MKVKKLFVFFCFLNLGFNSYGQDIASIWTEASTAYTEKDFMKADSLYRFIFDLGNESSELYYNLGNCAIKRNDVASAILWYERALLLAPKDENVKRNLRFANEMKLDKTTPPVDFLIQRYWNDLSNMTTPTKWGIASLIFFALFFVLGMAMIISRTLFARRSYFILTLLALITCVMSFFLGWHRDSLQYRSGAAIVFEHVLKVKSMPSETSVDLFVLHEGTKVFVKERLSGWVEIETYGDVRGWVPENSLKNI